MTHSITKAPMFGTNGYIIVCSNKLSKEFLFREFLDISTTQGEHLKPQQLFRTLLASLRTENACHTSALSAA
jgi:hypothetical protein